jgi:hypothetical protein
MPQEVAEGANIKGKAALLPTRSTEKLISILAIDWEVIGSALSALSLSRPLPSA